MSRAAVEQNQIPPYRQSVAEVLTALGTDAQLGLSAGEARARLERYGKNELTRGNAGSRPGESSSLSSTMSSSSCCSSPRSISAGLWLYERDSALPYEAMAIFAIVLLNAAHGLRPAVARRTGGGGAAPDVGGARQRHSRRRAAEHPGEPSSCPATSSSIEEGDTIPADARLIQSTALQTAEAALTGESLPVSKDIAPIAEEAGLGDRAQHDLQRHGGDLRARARGGHGDGDANRNGAHRRDAERSAGRDHAAAKGARPRRQTAGTDRRHHRGRDDRDDHPR